jgi:acetyltransferase-like isoleucine patch superfamily enzyme
MKEYVITDIVWKIKYKIQDYFLKLKWLILLKKLGPGSFIRSEVKIIGNTKRIKIGSKFKIYERSTISIGKGSINIGNNGLIGVGTYINCGNENLIIGDNVSIAPYCNFFTNSHHYSPGKLFINCYKNGDICIGNNVLIGSHTVVLPGVSIGDNVVIGSNSLVTKNIPSNSVFAGTPAKFVKNIPQE